MHCWLASPRSLATASSPALQERPATAPMHGSVRVPEGMLGRIIGPQGATVKEIEEQYDVRVDIQDSGERPATARWWPALCRACVHSQRPGLQIPAVACALGAKQPPVVQNGDACPCSPCNQCSDPPPACNPPPLASRSGQHLWPQPGGVPGSGGPHPGPGGRKCQGVCLLGAAGAGLFTRLCRMGVPMLSPRVALMLQQCMLAVGQHPCPPPSSSHHCGPCCRARLTTRRLGRRTAGAWCACWTLAPCWSWRGWACARCCTSARWRPPASGPSTTCSRWAGMAGMGGWEAAAGVLVVAGRLPHLVVAGGHASALVKAQHKQTNRPPTRHCTLHPLCPTGGPGRGCAVPGQGRARQRAAEPQGAAGAAGRAGGGAEGCGQRRRPRSGEVGAKRGRVLRTRGPLPGLLVVRHSFQRFVTRGCFPPR